jgi:hypothetical protein
MVCWIKEITYSYPKCNIVAIIFSAIGFIFASTR